MSEDLTKKLTKTDSEKLNAILASVQNLDGRFDNLEGRFDNLEGRFDNLEGRFDNLEGRFGGVETRVNGIDSRLQHLEETVEQRLHDTRPIWQKVVTDIAQLQAGQQRLEEGQKCLRDKMLEFHSTVRDVNRDQIVINDSLRRIHMDLHSIDGRLHRLELTQNQHNSST